MPAAHQEVDLCEAVEEEVVEQAEEHQEVAVALEIVDEGVLEEGQGEGVLVPGEGERGVVMQTSHDLLAFEDEGHNPERKALWRMVKKSGIQVQIPSLVPRMYKDDFAKLSSEQPIMSCS